MPTGQAVQRAREDAREGKAPSTQAGEFVREEIEHVRQGKHGARNAKQAIAIGLSKARRAGIPLRAPGTGSAELKQKAAQDHERGRHPKKPSKRRSRGVSRALRRESTGSTSRQALSKQARGSARTRASAARRRSARRAARTRKNLRRV